MHALGRRPAARPSSEQVPQVQRMPVAPSRMHTRWASDRGQVYVARRPHPAASTVPETASWTTIDASGQARSLAARARATDWAESAHPASSAQAPRARITFFMAGGGVHHTCRRSRCVTMAWPSCGPWRRQGKLSRGPRSRAAFRPRVHCSSLHTARPSSAHAAVGLPTAEGSPMQRRRRSRPGYRRRSSRTAQVE